MRIIVGGCSREPHIGGQAILAFATFLGCTWKLEIWFDACKIRFFRSYVCVEKFGKLQILPQKVLWTFDTRFDLVRSDAIYLLIYSNPTNPF